VVNKQRNTEAGAESLAADISRVHAQQAALGASGSPQLVVAVLRARGVVALA
jgi:hypothetical protein